MGRFFRHLKSVVRLPRHSRKKRYIRQIRIVYWNAF